MAIKSSTKAMLLASIGISRAECDPSSVRSTRRILYQVARLPQSERNALPTFPHFTCQNSIRSTWPWRRSLRPRCLQRTFDSSPPPQATWPLTWAECATARTVSAAPSVHCGACRQQRKAGGDAATSAGQKLAAHESQAGRTLALCGPRRKSSTMRSPVTRSRGWLRAE
jgi:hypothetical protein